MQSDRLRTVDSFCRMKISSSFHILHAFITLTVSGCSHRLEVVDASVMYEFAFIALNDIVIFLLE